MMDWLPVATNFRSRLENATKTGDAKRRIEMFAALSRQRLGFVETLLLDRALGQVPQGHRQPGFTAARLAILASSTVDQLLPGIRVAGLRRNLLLDVHLGAYGQYRQLVLDSASSMHRFKPQVVLFALTAREAIAGIPLAASAAQAEDAIARAIEELRTLWRRVRGDLNATIVQQNFLDVSEPVFGSFDQLVPGAPARLIARLNDRLREAAEADGVLLLDIARAGGRYGLDALFDVGRWLQGKLEISPQAAPLYGDLVARLIAAHFGLSKKCLVLDLDNTLWGGVVGDDGIDGIVVGQGSAAGEAFLAMQSYARRLKERGIILAVCSKNDAAIAEAAFRDHPEMVLERSDFAAFAANWDDKAANLEAIAARLNIGLDSLVFVDDNAVERARIRASLPMVAVPELPEDPAHYVRCLADAGYFEAVVFTAEDAQRAEQYAANAEREALRETSQSMDGFLCALGMSLVCGSFTAVDQSRVTQLFNKTNQFNTTTRRYTPDEIAARSSDAAGLTLQFRLADKFGDNGLVSALVLRPDAEHPDVLEIENWVMSCRVFGRQLEHEAMNIAVETARARGVRAFRATYIPTKKNAVIEDLYQDLGFTCANATMPTNGPTHWHLALDSYAGRKTQIARVEKAK